MVTVRVLAAMTIGALVAATGALFLGEYEFDETVPILVGPMLAFIVAEIVVSIGRHRSPTMAGILATWSATAVLLAGGLDANGTEPIKSGAYLSAALAAGAGALRGNDWFRARRTRRRAERGAGAAADGAEVEGGSESAGPSVFAPSDWLADAETHADRDDGAVDVPAGSGPTSPGPDRRATTPRLDRVAEFDRPPRRPLDRDPEPGFSRPATPDHGYEAAERPEPEPARSGPVPLRPRRRPVGGPLLPPSDDAPTWVTTPRRAAPAPVSPRPVEDRRPPARQVEPQRREPRQVEPQRREPRQVEPQRREPRQVEPQRREPPPAVRRQTASLPPEARRIAAPRPDQEGSLDAPERLSRAQSRAEAKAARAAERARRAAAKAEQARQAAAGRAPVDPTDPDGVGEGWPEDPGGWGDDLADLVRSDAWDDEDDWS